MGSRFVRQLLILIFPAIMSAGPPPVALTVEHLQNPLGIGVTRPRLSWQLPLVRRGSAQSAYQLQAAKSPEALRTRDLLWDSGRVNSEASNLVTYGGLALNSADCVVWRVRYWDEIGELSDWSEPASFELGLLEPADWIAQWIRPHSDESDVNDRPVSLLRNEFQLPQAVVFARAYVSALGLYELEINGRRVGDQLLTPGWTPYRSRLAYQTYDVTDLLRPGANGVGISVADGWFRGELIRGSRNNFGRERAALFQLKVTYADGSTAVFGSGSNWKMASGPILFSGIYDGETYDARLERTGWSEPGYDDTGWTFAIPFDHPKTILIASASPPIRHQQDIKPVSIFRTPGGAMVADFGQNLVGRVGLSVKGTAGTTVSLRHAEVLGPDGNIYTESLRGADQAVRYTLKGMGQELYEPHFTFQGFRYVAIEGYPGELTQESITARVICSDLESVGNWECSNPRLNQLYHNIVWSQRGNFVGLPTDCPQRDERLGWTGDAQVFARTAAFNMNVAGFFTQWLGDLMVEQRADGSMPWVVPDVTSIGQRSVSNAAAGWGDAAVIIPWTMYLAYGDRQLLERQYPSMQGWFEWMHGQSEGLIWRHGFQFGDWLAYAAPTDEARRYPGATTSPELIGTAFFAHAADLLARTAVVLGREEDAAKYRELFEDIRASFCHEFVTATGRVGEGTQTAYALVLTFDLLPESLRVQAADRLAEDVRHHGNHLTTGILGTPYVCPVLSRFGHLDTAYTLLLQNTYPSWLYPITQGATTIWERWDGIKPDGTFQSPTMNSFNHYAYGSVGEWLFRSVSGIDTDPAKPGYKRAILAPQPGGGLEWVNASLQSPYGEIRTRWEIVGDGLRMAFRVPANTRAEVRLPGARLADVTEGGAPLPFNPDSPSRQEADAVVLDLESGDYLFQYPAERLVGQIRHGPTYALADPLQVLIALPAARAALQEYAPALLHAPARFMSWRLSDIADVRPEWLPPAARQPLEAALARLPK